MHKPLIIFVILLLGAQAFAQTAPQYRYLIRFKDKNNNSFNLNNPNAFLSSKALERRTKQGIALNEQDVPVSPNYLQGLRQAGAKVLFPLKWINAALVQCRPDQLKALRQLSFVQDLYFPFALDSLANGQGGNAILPGQELQQQSLQAEVPVYGAAATQIKQIGGDSMHIRGFLGSNVHLTLLDDGYLGVQSTAPFQAIRAGRLLGTLVTSPRRNSVYDTYSHGTSVLSTIAASVPGMYSGIAPEVKVALAQTEESEHEVLVEEVNWLRGAEWADSLGTDIIQSSLGYSTFDLPIYNHRYSEMDGQSTLVSKAAQWAANRGILVVVSAGNEGSNAWKYLTAPSDAKDVLCIGAVNAQGQKASFSSFGPSSDGRTKPDVVAMGLATSLIPSSGTLATASGTSFSAPLIAGWSAGLIQAFPQARLAQVLTAIRSSGHLYKSPNESLGFGIPNFNRAYLALRNQLILSQAEPGITWKFYPNPAHRQQALRLRKSDEGPAVLEMIQANGALLRTWSWEGKEKEISLEEFQIGKYYLRFTDKNGSQSQAMILY